METTSLKDQTALESHVPTESVFFNSFVIGS